MLLEDQHPDNKSIMVAVLGAPNVGKSSMINYLLGMDLAVVTHKPQTTRNRYHCIFTIDHTEIILVDTPGIHKSSQELNKRLNEQAREGTEGADLNLLLVDITRPLLVQVENFAKMFEGRIGPTWLVFSKADKVEKSSDLPFEEIYEKAREIIPNIKKYFLISTKSELNMNGLTGAICDAAEFGPHYYKGEVSNKNERFFVSEYIREQAFHLLKDEIPYEVAVVIDEYRDIKEQTTDTKGKAKVKCHISATIIVNRPSQRGIVVGKQGAMIKEIGTRSRKKIEVMVGGQVHLNLHVKVIPKWFKNNYVLEEIGIPRAKDSARVWRAR